MYLYNARIVRLVDADTMDAIIDLGFHMTTKQRLRLIGVQAPESGTKAGDLATAIMTKIIASVDYKVQIQTEKTGSFGRWLATIYIEGQNLNLMMIDEGIATKYKK